jgi:hypothetical protein
MFNVVGALFFILLYCIEVYFHIPLVLALLNYLTPVLENQASIVFLLFNLTSAFFSLSSTPLSPPGRQGNRPLWRKKDLLRHNIFWISSPEIPNPAWR